MEDKKIIENEEKIEVLTDFDMDLAQEMCDDIPEEVTVLTRPVEHTEEEKIEE